MNSRQRVLRTFHFEPVDRPAYDLMEGCVWPELLAYFRERYQLQQPDDVIEFLDPDFRWTFLENSSPDSASAPPLEAASSLDTELASEARSIPTGPHPQSKSVAGGPLADASTLADLERYPWPDPGVLVPPDYLSLRARYPDKALVFCPGWMPLFWTACEAFGMQTAMIRMINEPLLFDAFIRRYHAFCMDLLTRGARAARGYCDLALLGDDFASQQSLLISPDLWRKHIKPYLAQQVHVLRENGLLVLFHSCGAVRSILPDLIEIGVNGLLVFQTTARGMDAPSIAREFGGRLVFYGGIDVQRLLSFGTPAEVAAVVRANLAAFADCGGYVVANSHHTIASIQGANLHAMCQAARLGTLISPEKVPPCTQP